MTPKRKFMVFKRTAEPINIDTGRGRRKTWRENGGKADFFYVSSESEAKDIDALYGSKGTQDVWVKEHGQAGHDASYHSDGHTAFFGPTRAFCEGWERIFGGKNGKVDPESHQETGRAS